MVIIDFKYNKRLIAQWVGPFSSRCKNNFFETSWRRQLLEASLAQLPKLEKGKSCSVYNNNNISFTCLNQVNVSKFLFWYKYIGLKRLHNAINGRRPVSDLLIHMFMYVCTCSKGAVEIDLSVHPLMEMFNCHVDCD